MSSAAFAADPKSVAQTTLPNVAILALPPSSLTAGTIRTGSSRLEDSFCDRSLAQTAHTDSLMSADDDKVKLSGVRMQQDDPDGISMLHAYSEPHAFRLGCVAERCDVGPPCAATRGEWLGDGNRLDDCEFSVVLSTEGQCASERRPGGSREINRTEDARELNHDQCSVSTKKQGTAELTLQTEGNVYIVWLVYDRSARKPNGLSVSRSVPLAHPTPIERQVEDQLGVRLILAGTCCAAAILQERRPVRQTTSSRAAVSN